MKNLLTVIIASILMLSVGMLNSEKSPSKFKLNFSERFRFEGWDNTISLDNDTGDSAAFDQHRTSVMVQWFPNHKIEFSLKLTNEFINYLSPKTIEFDVHEVIFDQLYLKWKNPANLPLTLTLGRQDIMLGEGFLVAEGTPLDGPRTIYFNAVRIDYKFNNHQQLTAFYAYQPKTDNILPVINDREQILVEEPMRGLAFYYSGTLNKNSIEAYFIKKYIDGIYANPVKSTINTIGARLILPLAAKLSLTTEVAYQFGTWGNFDRTAKGGYFHLDYSIDEKLPFLKTITLGGIYLSGDDPATPKMEEWDPIFSRWPKWSASYIYTFTNEGRVAYWSNLNSLYISLIMDFTERMNFELTWHHFGANERKPASFPGGSGKTRGELIIGKLNFKINKQASGYIVWEHFNPGNFYFTGSDRANWFRVELIFSF